MRVALVARREDRLRALAETSAPGRIAALAVAVRRRGARRGRRRRGARVLERWGRIDLLVNNAGYARHALFKDEASRRHRAHDRTNYLGTVYTIKAVLPAMRARGEGWIVNVSSVAGKLGQPDEAAYSATKFAVTGLSEALAYELAPLGIHVMTVYPALVRTEMFTPDVLARMPERVKRTFIEPPVFTARGAPRARARRARGDGAALRGDRLSRPAALPALLPSHDGQAPPADPAGRHHVASLYPRSTGSVFGERNARPVIVGGGASGSRRRSGRRSRRRVEGEPRLERARW